MRSQTEIIAMLNTSQDVLRTQKTSKQIERLRGVCATIWWILGADYEDAFIYANKLTDGKIIEDIKKGVQKTLGDKKCTRKLPHD